MRISHRGINFPDGKYLAQYVLRLDNDQEK